MLSGFLRIIILNILKDHLPAAVALRLEKASHISLTLKSANVLGELKMGDLTNRHLASRRVYRKLKCSFFLKQPFQRDIGVGDVKLDAFDPDLCVDAEGLDEQEYNGGDHAADERP